MPTERFFHAFDADDADDPPLEDEEVECLDDHDGDGRHCAGRVEYRMALSGTGRSFMRCEKHWGLRLEEQDRINDRYPDSPLPPSDFDPSYAGERWNEDD